MKDVRIDPDQPSPVQMKAGGNTIKSEIKGQRSGAPP
jgi:hypothetical protein